jgi:tetratricopeptide (TPR) repeat protein
MSDVFISYSRKNSEFARRLIERLTRAGKDSWVDWEGIPLTSPNWWSEIKAGIEGANSFMFIMSPDSMASVVCNLELDYAIELGKRIVPVVYQDVQTRDSFASIADFKPDEAMQERLAGKDALLIARDNWQRLSHINWVFFREADDFDTAYERLITTVEADLEYVKAHTRYLTRALEWAGGRREDLLLFGGEIDRAEVWLAKGEAYAAKAKPGETVAVVNPLPQPVQHEYIGVSRRAQNRRRLRVISGTAGAVVAVIFAVSASVVGVQATASANAAASREAEAVTAVAEGQATLGAVSTQVAIAQVTVTQAAIVRDIVGSFANALLQQRDNPSRQIEEANRLIERYPDQALAWQTRGLIYGEQGDYKRAIDDYDQAVALDPADGLVFLNRGNAYTEQGEYTRAIADFDQAIALDPADAFAFYNRGNAYAALGEYTRAIVDYDQAITLDLAIAATFNNRGNAYQTLGETERAIADYDQAITLDPAYAEAFNNRGRAHHNLGDYRRAIADYDQVIALDPTDALAFYNRGIAHFELGETVRAIADFDQATALDPANAQAFYNRGVAYASVGQNDRAIADYDQAIALDPSDAQAFNNRGVTYGMLGEYTLAIADYDRAIALDPASAESFGARGISYFFRAQDAQSDSARLEYLSQALRDWREAERLGLSLPEAVRNAMTEIEAELQAATPAP